MGHLYEYLIFANMLCFFAFAVDKVIARCRLNIGRIPEETLFGLMMLGPFGALMGMSLFCHKTRKCSFWTRLTLCCALHLWLFIQFVEKKYAMMMDPGSLGIDGVETEAMPGRNQFDDALDAMPDHPEL